MHLILLMHCDKTPWPKHLIEEFIWTWIVSHKDTFRPEYVVCWFHSPILPFPPLPLPVSLLGVLRQFYLYFCIMCPFMSSWLCIKSRDQRWAKTRTICLSEPDLIYLTRLAPVASIFLQTVQPHSSLWLKDGFVYCILPVWPSRLVPLALESQSHLCDMWAWSPARGTTAGS